MSGGDTESGNHQNGKTDNDQNGKTGGKTSETKVDGESAKDSRERRLIEGAVVCTVIAVVWGLLTLPVIFYYLPQVSPSSSFPRMMIMTHSKLLYSLASSKIFFFRDRLYKRLKISNEVSNISPWSLHNR